MLCGAGALIKGCFTPVLAVKGRLHRALSPICAFGYAMPLRPNKAQTAVHGCHYLGDMAVHMSGHGLVFELLLLFEGSYICCKLF